MTETIALTQTTSGLFTGLMLILLIGMFIGLFLWAWSGKQKKAFEQASQLPLAELEEDRMLTTRPTDSC